MSDYRPEIETLEEWNEAIAACGCCQMPECPIPSKQCQSANGSATLFWVLAVLESGVWKYYATRRWDYSDGGFKQWQVSGYYEVVFNSGIMVVDETENFTEGFPQTGTITTSTSGLIDIDTQRTAAIAAMQTADVWSESGLVTGTVCEASTTFFTPSDSVTPLANVVKTRFRWVIPDTWEGSYFKITWDIIDEPDGWDADPPTATRTFLLADQTWEWTGPGDPEDPDSWKSGWYTINPPAVPGTRRVVNVRFECYGTTPYGNKPQVTGEAVELPDP